MHCTTTHHEPTYAYSRCSSDKATVHADGSVNTQLLLYPYPRKPLERNLMRLTLVCFPTDKQKVHHPKLPDDGLSICPILSLLPASLRGCRYEYG